MSFLAPFFLLGGLAVAGPILFHLIRRTTRESTSFSSLMFLDPSPPRVTRRSRLENLWLLLLRCLALALLALGFARPLLHTNANRDSPDPSAGRRTAILLDVSASMRRENLWPDAQRKTEELIRNAGPNDQVSLLAFDDHVRPVFDLAEWKKTPPDVRVSSAVAKLNTLAPGWSGTHLDTALTAAAERFLEPGEDQSAAAEIVVIGDLQEGSRLDALQAYEWPRGVSVRLVPIAARQLENASLQWLAEAGELDRAGKDQPVRVRLTNVAEAKREQFQVEWRDSADPSKTSGTPSKIDAYVPAGQSRIIKPPSPPPGSTSLVLTGDDVTFDNTLFVLPPQLLQTPLLFIGTDGLDDPRGSLYYLRRAFPKTRRQSVEIIAHPGPEPVPAFQLQQAQLAVLGDGASGEAVDSARDFAAAGKIVVLPLSSPASAVIAARLLGVPELPASEATVKEYALLAQIDFQHPFFSSFADPRFSDFTKIHFWKYRRIDAGPLLGAKVTARFESGDPAIVQVPVGKGSAVIFTSTWRPLDSQLALSSKFVPLLQGILDQSTNLPAQKAQYFVGDEIPLSITEAVSVRKPDGALVAVSPGTNFSGTDQPGIYSVEPGARRFAVNLPPEESRTSPLSVDRLASLGVPLDRAARLPKAQEARVKAQAASSELESRQKLWRWLIVFALAVLLLETLIATKLSRHSVTPQYSNI